MPSVSAGTSTKTSTAKSKASAVRSVQASSAQPSGDVDRPSSKSLENGRKNVATSRVTARTVSDENNQTQQPFEQTHKNESLDTSSGDQPPKKTKKKTSSVVGFLTLKEPSTKALEEFAAAEKERAKQRGGAVAGVSTQRLPDHVPKVNSKWDGMPETTSAKRSSHDTKRSVQLARDSALSTWTTRSGFDGSLSSPREQQSPVESSYPTTPNETSSPSHSTQTSPGSRQYSELDPLPELSPFQSISSTAVTNIDAPKPIESKDTKLPSPTNPPDVYYTQPTLANMGNSSTSSSHRAAGSSGSDSNKPTTLVEEKIVSAPPSARPPQVPNFSRPFSRG